MNYCEITKQYLIGWIELGEALWPEHTKNEITESFNDILGNAKETAFICTYDKQIIGFINLSIRVDYVEGSSSSPVGYIEGIYVLPEYRKRGISRKLVKMGEQWALKRNCTEFASDVELDNKNSQKFHERIGFKEANRIVHYIKDIRN